MRKARQREGKRTIMHFLMAFYGSNCLTRKWSVRIGWVWGDLASSDGVLFHTTSGHYTPFLSQPPALFSQAAGWECEFT